MYRSTCGGDLPIVMVGDIAQYFYCPRKIYFLKVLGAPFVAKSKMRVGACEDEKERRRLLERKSVYGFQHSEVRDVMHDVFLDDENLGLAGQLDALIRLEGGELMPVDSKFTDVAIVHRHYKKQLVAYSLLVDSRFQTNVVRGIIYFTKQKQPLLVPITIEEKRALLKDLHGIRNILSGESIPRKVSERKCGYCEFSKYCV